MKVGVGPVLAAIAAVGYAAMLLWKGARGLWRRQYTLSVFAGGRFHETPLQGARAVAASLVALTCAVAILLAVFLVAAG